MVYEPSHAERIRYKRLQDAAYQAGLDAVTSLEAALALAGLVLPSLTNDPVGSRGFVRLGGCSVSVAQQLAEVIAAGAHVLHEQRT
ncbi:MULTISPECIES: hypothetical protein [unclassified Streptomyces]|uniref:hypothetical protein n=1 Tax=unclassified Streptomyces TaxID=2593676 RepID=UPI0004BDFFE3|nr:MULTISPECIES: hypothetical protein [unclassified Streptomyces]